ncbi:MAG: histidine kinase, partial [Anaerolineae bacterium]
DLRMPRMDGYQLCEILKADTRFRHIPVIFLSVAGETLDKVRAFELGAVDYIIKPFQVQEVTARIHTHLTIFQQQQELIRQRHEIETLRDTVAVVNSTLELGEVLTRILANVERVVHHDCANVMLIEEDYARVFKHRGYPQESLHTLMESRFPIDDTRNLTEMVATHQPVWIGDVTQDENWERLHGLEAVRSYMGTPILSGDDVIGFIGLESFTTNAFHSEHAERLKAFADQVAIAIRNAQVFEQVKALAAEEERQRIARDLHDAVSQTLFSASVIAETLPFLVDRDRAEFNNGLQRLAKLANGALAEMRTLLVELRPAALLETELSVLLKYLVNSLQTRTDANLSYTTEGSENEISPEAKVNLYRITQEALNNSIKHARARNISLDLNMGANEVSVRIIDDGNGFVPEQVPRNHMGLLIMGERAAKANISLIVRSALQQGTHIEAHWQKSSHV